MICLVSGQPYLFGITSWGNGCGDRNSPGIYAKVSSAIEWMGSIINRNYIDDPDHDTSDILTGTNGSITHLDYANSENIFWNIESDCAILYLYSEIFELESGYDYLIIDGESFTGSYPVDVLVYNSSVLVQFISDSSETRTGFILRWRCSDGSDGPPTRPPEVDHIPFGTKCYMGNAFTEENQLKVYYGTEAREHSWPWIVSLQDYSGHFCGGSIVNNEFVITVAHCCESIRADDIIAVIGEHDLSYISSAEAHIKVLEIIMHPQYALDHPVANDICLLRTERFEFTEDTIQPVCLPGAGEHVQPDDADDYPTNQCFTAGWGQSQAGYPDKLQSARMNIFSSSYCSTNSPFDHEANTYTDDHYYNYDYYGYHEEQHFCTGHMGHPMPGSCFGDSGGPLVCLENGQPVMYGLVSYGLDCNAPESPTMMVKVASYIDWMGSVINRNQPHIPKPILDCDSYEKNLQKI